MDISPIINALKTIFSSVSSQWVYNIFGILGFVMSGLIFLIRLFSRRKKIDLQVYDYTKHSYVIQLFVNIQNNSYSSICIHSISLVNGDSSFSCELIPKKIKGSGDDLIKTPMFPLNLSPRHGFQCFLEFLFCEEIQLAPDKTLDLKIHTNRGVINKSLTLGNTSHYLHIH